MKKFSSRIAIWFVPAVLLLMGGLVSCNPDDEEEQSQLSRMFMPTGTVTSTSAESQVRLSWKEALHAAGDISYTVEVAADTLFQTPVVYTGTTDTTSIVITDDNIPARQKFFARIKTNAKGDVPESKWLVSNSFTIRGVQLFVNTPVNSQDVTDRSVRLRFNSRTGVTKIVVTPAGGTAREVALSQSDLTAGFVIVDGLISGTNYAAEIFTGNKSNGVTTFQTKAPLTGNIVDLRGIVGRPSVLEDTITQVPNGSTIILKPGAVYTINTTIRLNKSVTITSGSDLTVTTLASINFIGSSGNFNITAGSNIENITFKDVNLTGSDAGASYVFNINAASTITNMLFENVRASKFRGVVRSQSATTTITNFTINNSVVDSIGNFGVVNVDFATSQFQNIAIKNSTIYKAEKIITSRNNSTTVLLENLTINEAPASGQYLVDYSTAATNNVSGGIVIRNSILGIGKAGNLTIRGVRANASTLVQVSGTYATSDHVETSNPTPNLTAYNNTSLNLWQDPKNGNFRFKDANFAGKATAGDPRWR